MANSGSESISSTLTTGCDFVTESCCDLCKQRGKSVEAAGYCSDCQDYLCSDCFNYHLIPRPMRHHVLLDQHQMPKDQQQTRRGDTCTEACTVHPQKTVEYVCSEHDDVGCSVCMTLNHRNCKRVEHIPDIASDILTNIEYTDLQKRITALTKRTTTVIQTSQDQLKLSQTYHANALESVKDLKKDVSKALKSTEQKLIKEACATKEDDVTKIKSQENKYKDILKDSQTLSSKFRSLQNNGQFCQMFIAMKRARKEMGTTEARFSKTGKNITARNYRLIKSKELQMFLDSPETMVKLEVTKHAMSGSRLGEFPLFMDTLLESLDKVVVKYA